MSIGTSIAKARSLAGLSIDELSAVTKLRSTLLREMEADIFTNCGGQMYARGHVRNIAVALKVDDKEFLRIFDEEQGVEKRSMQDLLVENSVMRQPNETKKVSWKTLITISLLSLSLVGLVQIIVSNTQVEQAAAPVASTLPSATPEQSASATPSEQSTFTTGQGVEVIVNTTRAKSWLFVSDAQGRTLFSGELSQGASKIFTSDSRLDLKVGNAGGVDLLVNGKQVPAIGRDSQVVSVSYGVDS
ncbi:MAG: helix-turn-helix domain-containing protein [Candidatus Planktophila sp.]